MTTGVMLAIIMMPFSWLSAGALSLVVLHQGKEAALRVTVIASLAALVLSWIIFSTPIFAIGYLLFLWLPTALVAYILRQTVSLTLSVQILTGVGLLAVLAMYLLFPTMGETWREAFEQILKPALQQAGAQIDPAQLDMLLNLFARAVPGLLSIVLIFNVLMGLLLGRWWQAALYNPGGLSREFNELRLGKVIAAVTVVLLVINNLISNDWVLGSMLVMVIVTLIQGTAVMHGVVAGKQLSRGWLFGFYVLLFVIPQLTIILAIVGLLDAWVDIRKRLLPGMSV
jgi:hypothetical protein